MSATGLVSDAMKSSGLAPLDSRSTIAFPLPHLRLGGVLIKDGLPIGQIQMVAVMQWLL
jgi:hypothetical protein